MNSRRRGPGDRAAKPLRVRIGVAAGLVVVGDLIGAGAAQEQAVVGETPNLAARLQALATCTMGNDQRPQEPMLRLSV